MTRVYLVAGVHPTKAGASGIRAYVVNLARGLHEHGYEVHLVGAGPPAELHYCEFHSVTCAFPVSQYEFARHLWIWLMSRPRIRNSIIHAQRPDDLLPFFFRTYECTFICTLHGDPYRGVAQRRPLARLLYSRVESHVLKKATRIVSVSKNGLETYLRRHPEVEGKAEYVPIGIDLRKFRPIDCAVARAALGIPDRTTYLFAGRLETEKRVHVLLEASMRLSPPPSVLIAGKGTLEIELRNHLGADNATFLGSVPQDEMPLVLSAADALILSSSFEGMPTVALEALACGTPVISTKVGDIPAIIEEGRSGYFFDGTSASLEKVLTEHEDDLPSMRSRCPGAAKRFDVDAMLEKIEAIYTSSLELPGQTTCVGDE